MRGVAAAVLVWCFVVVRAGAERTLVSYTFFLPTRTPTPRKPWSRCAREGGVCGCATRVRYGSRIRSDWVEVDGARHEGFVNCSREEFPLLTTEGMLRECQCKGAGRELTQYAQCEANLKMFVERGVAEASEVDFVFNAVGESRIPDFLEDAKRFGNVK
eukprot:Hpha_TRINITY_DN23247_c0_g1::TRINITY_DN23247_c0_g1_i1::g.30163::m.30163